MTSHVTRVRAVDVVVIGGGIAGLSAALMMGRARRSVCVIDSGSPRNRNAAAVHAVLGHEGVAPGELLARGRDELSRYDVEVRDGRVTDARSSERAVAVTLADGSQITARALVLACGIVDDLPDIPGVPELWGTRVLHCPYCHGWEVRERPLGVLATGPFSIHQVEMLRQWSDDITYFANGSAAGLDAATLERLGARNIAVIDAAVTALHGEGLDRSADDGAVVVETADGERRRLAAVFTGGLPQFDEALLAGLGLKVGAEPGSGIAVDPMNATSVPRVYAAGNLVAPWASIPIAMASGAQAGAGVNAALVAEDIDMAVSGARAHSQPAAVQ